MRASKEIAEDPALNLPLVGVWVSMLKIPYHILYPGILVFIAIGIYSVNSSYVDVIMVGVLGLLGYALSLLKFPIAPLLLGYILGPLMESNLRRSLLISGGDVSIFWKQPITLAIMLLALAILLLPLVTKEWRKRLTRELPQD